MNGIKKENALAEGKLRQTTYQAYCPCIAGYFTRLSFINTIYQCSTFEPLVSLGLVNIFVMC